MLEAAKQPTLRCTGCGTELAPSLLACPACRQLVHAEELKSLAADAQAAGDRKDDTAALTAWTRALSLLPKTTKQHATVAAEVARLSARVPRPAATQARTPPGWLGKLGPLGVLGFGAWKLLGVAKLAAFLSLIAAFGVYWQAWGWEFAALFLLSVYLHELGHVVALRRVGIPASLPMFIPGVGAFIRMHAVPSDARTEARVGLAGPLAGLAVALCFYGLWAVTGSPLMRAISHVGAIVNLFNLIPVWQLDGSRGFASLTQLQRFLVASVTGAALAFTHEGLLWLILIFGVVRALSPRAPENGDLGGLVLFDAILVSLSALAFVAR